MAWVHFLTHGQHTEQNRKKIIIIIAWFCVRFSRLPRFPSKKKKKSENNLAIFVHLDCMWMRIYSARSHLYRGEYKILLNGQQVRVGWARDERRINNNSQQQARDSNNNNSMLHECNSQPASIAQATGNWKKRRLKKTISLQPFCPALSLSLSIHLARFLLHWDTQYPAHCIRV